MKLIHCKKCHDVVRLIETRWRMCECETCGGQYNVDFLSATVGGDCDILGIPNPFFDEVNKYLIDENGGKEWYRKKMGWGNQDIWYGGGPGDLQIHRIESPEGPRLKMRVEVIDDSHTKSIITDKRDYKIDGKRLKEFVLENVMRPSFKMPAFKMIKMEKQNPTTQVVREAMKIVSKDVRVPKVVRDGIVKQKLKKVQNVRKKKK